jgi:bifunctional ADP-heptose synthase (sugar kinase/adenylyltransferase)
VDTRAKILDPGEAADAARQARRLGKRIKLVTGYFDPLLAVHARRLSEIASSGAVLFVVIREPARPLLRAQARAELVAALAMVDYVVPGDALLRADEVYSEESADERRTQDLMMYVQNRQS